MKAKPSSREVPKEYTAFKDLLRRVVKPEQNKKQESKQGK
jgi:hypothetical protein